MICKKYLKNTTYIHLLYCLLIYNTKIMWVLARHVRHATATMLLRIIRIPPNGGKIMEKLTRVCFVKSAICVMTANSIISQYS